MEKCKINVDKELYNEEYWNIIEKFIIVELNIYLRRLSIEINNIFFLIKNINYDIEPILKFLSSINKELDNPIKTLKLLDLFDNISIDDDIRLYDYKKYGFI